MTATVGDVDGDIGVVAAAAAITSDGYGGGGDGLRRHSRLRRSGVHARVVVARAVPKSFHQGAIIMMIAGRSGPAVPVPCRGVAGPACQCGCAGVAP